MQLPTRCDVLIVGAGPAGMALAAELRRRRTDSIVVIDQLAQGANESRAAVVHARTLEVLEPLGIAQELIGEGLQIAAFRGRNRDRVLLSLDFREIPSAYRYALMCPQDRTEHVLQRKLESMGQPIVRPCTLAGLTLRQDAALARIDLAGSSHVVDAGWIVGCDGGHSAVREAAGIAFEGGSYEESFVLADVHMDWPLGQTEGSLFFSPDGLMVIAPLPGPDRYRIVATAAQAPEQPDAAFVQGLLDSRGPTGSPARLREVLWSSRFRIHHKVAAAFRQGRVMLCGDAAHVHSPAGGQGMNTGIQDGIALAGPLSDVVLGGNEAQLGRWAEQRRKNALRLVGLTDRMTRAATVRSPAGRFLRDTVMAAIARIPAARRRITISLAELDRK